MSLRPRQSHGSLRVFGTRLRAAAVGCVLAFAVATTAGTATLTQVAWEPVPDSGVRSLALHFAAGAPEIEIERTEGGLYIKLPGADRVQAPLPEGIRLERAAAGVRLVVEDRRLEVRSVRWAEGWARIVLVVRDPLANPAASTYRIGVGDVVSVSVYKSDEFSGDFTVSPEGMISLPFVGPVRAAGRTEAELAADLTALLERDYLVNPQVAVTVKSYQSQFVYVTGAIAQARRVALRPGVLLKDVLTEAGVALAPGQEVVLSRTGSGGEALVLDPAAVEAADAPVPQDGDVLTVQERKNFVFLNGELRDPGRIAHTPGMTLLQAISQARGLTEWGSKKGVRIRRNSDAGPTEIVVDLRKVEDGAAADPVLMPGDVVLVKRRAL